jgi:hypothetical protein
LSLRAKPVVAEKFQAIVMIGQANTRLKDYYDLWVLSPPQLLIDVCARPFSPSGR